MCSTFRGDVLFQITDCANVVETRGSGVGVGIADLRALLVAGSSNVNVMSRLKKPSVELSVPVRNHIHLVSRPRAPGPQPHSPGQSTTCTWSETTSTWSSTTCTWSATAFTWSVDHVHLVHNHIHLVSRPRAPGPQPHRLGRRPRASGPQPHSPGQSTTCTWSASSSTWSVNQDLLVPQPPQSKQLSNLATHQPILRLPKRDTPYRTLTVCAM